MALGWKSQGMKTLTILILSILSVVAMAATRNVSGTWMVTSNGKANPGMKLVLSPQGGFKFIGSNYSSSGKYKVQGDKIELVWTKVDGQSVKPGSMKRALVLAPDNTFKIDQYTYARRG